MKIKGKRLSKEEWKEIKKLLKDPDRNISKIGKKYNISRNTIYTYAWRRKWLIKEEIPELTFLDKLKAYFKPK